MTRPAQSCESTLHQSIVVLLLALGSSRSLAAEYVVHVSIDGLSAIWMQSVLDAGGAPHFQRLQSQGAWTLNARTDATNYSTLPNHTSMLTGRPVLQVAGMSNTVHHGYTHNTYPPESETLHNAGNPNLSYIASVFDVAHDAGLSTAMFASKTKFRIFDQSYNSVSGAEHANGRDKIDYFYAFDNSALPSSENTQAEFLAGMASNHYRYSFVHYSDVDLAGHRFGWGSEQWNLAVGYVDNYLGQMLALIESDEALAGNTAIIVSADHGGSGTTHVSDLPGRTIPFFVWGTGVGHGDLYNMNIGARSDPGTAQVGYGTDTQPIRNGDGGNLALDLLGLEPIPGSLINGLQNLRVSEPGDFNLDGSVDAADYTVWRDTLGATGAYLAADGDGPLGTPDGQVNDFDYQFWKAHFGQSAIVSASPLVDNDLSTVTHVPEPTALAFATPMVLGWWFVSRRRG
jgi:hypothetical protein